MGHAASASLIARLTSFSSSIGGFFFILTLIIVWRERFTIEARSESFASVSIMIRRTCSAETSPSPVRVSVQADQMAALFAAEIGPLFQHILDDIAGPPWTSLTRISAFSIALRKPRLHITVDTTVLFFRIPCRLKSRAQMANRIVSPSTSSPFSSTRITLSASPSRAMPTSAFVSRTVC